MFSINTTSKTPVYEQLITQISDYILAGVLNENDALPSFRTLSAELSVNPNTIRKVYEHLDLMGITFTQQGKGVFISPQARNIICNSIQKDLPQLEKLFKKYKLSGVGMEEIQDMLRRIYND